ncbi:DUF2939 domain-containing protein [Duganella vulcania]|uniref:DUF2939 domain-containing protein n=1 Tax=Duganella vulcania TaxID=2692166 RepID=A0A845GET4_9BURK|nr:DUF2939 domain-containing protein [Duganella vulcania]MYM92814.1 DUF2939 domain-containing protein [Duganella vulcania]
MKIEQDTTAPGRAVTGTGLWAMLVAITMSALVMLGLIIYAPYYSFSQIQHSAEEANRERFEDFVDVDAVRGALVSEIRKGVAAQLNQAHAKQEVLDLVEREFVAPMVNRSVTADFMMHLLTGAAPPEGTRRTAQIGEVMTGRSGAPTIQKGYDGINRFVVRATDPMTNTEIQFVMMRDGLGWRLDEVTIPTFIDQLTKESAFNKSTGAAVTPVAVN